MTMDATTVEVIRGSLTYATEEMGIALRKSAYSPNIKERMDHSCALFDHKLRLVAQAEHIPVHLGSMALAVREGLARYRGSLEDGDMLLFNDPYISGTHLPDITIIAPAFYDDIIVGYAANKAHHTDVGGRAPGSIAGDSSELFQEGLIIPPVKFMKRSSIDTEISDIIGSNVRTPEVQMGDLRAQTAANFTGLKRFTELVRIYGIEEVREAIERIMDYSERRMVSEITRMPKGAFTATDFLEDTGISSDPAKITVKVTVRGEKIEFDYHG